MTVRRVFLPLAVAFAWVGVSAWMGWNGNSSLVFLVSGATVVLGGLAGLALTAISALSRSRSAREFGLGFLLAASIAAVSVVVNRSVKRAAIAESEARGEVVVRSLEAYRTKSGRYPRGLDEMGVTIKSPPVDPEGWHYNADAGCYWLQFSAGAEDLYTWSPGASSWHDHSNSRCAN